MADRGKVIDGLEETISYLRIKTGGAVDRCIQHQYDALELLKEQETIVLCKDCKYCEYPKSEKEWCKKGHLHGNAENWFCADGERG